MGSDIRRILLVDDLSEMRAWLGEIARTAFPGCEIDTVGTRADGIRAIETESYDLALIDLGLPDGSGVDVVRALRAAQPSTIGVVVTIFGDDAQIVAAFAAGAQGYLLKEYEATLLSRQLKQLADGIPALSPSVAARIIEHFRFTGPAAEPEEDLTAREAEVLGLIGRGLRNADVAGALGVSESTVASHIKAIYRKLGISSRAEASWHATRLGLRPDRGH